MECKLKQLHFLFTREIGINRYIVECKWRSKAEEAKTGTRINRYIVECKYNSSVSNNLDNIELIDT